MPDCHENVVTGAFGYTGKYITRLLLESVDGVTTLTGRPERPNPFGERVRAVPFNFDDPPALIESLRGATTLYNTYWVRFSHGGTTYDRAVANTKTLFSAAKAAGLRRVVHVSIANPSENSPLPYYSGKALLERALIESGISYAILRPTVIFGDEDILINNIAWLLRRFPVFAVPGSGAYRLQPIFVEDFAEIAVRAGRDDQNTVMDVVGPDIFTFDELVRLIARAVGSRSWICHVPPMLALVVSKLIGLLVGDVVLTRDEVKGLMSDLLISHDPPRGTMHIADWLAQNADRVGTHYASELGRHFR